MRKALRTILWVLTGLIAVNFLIMGLRWAVAPSGAAEALNMSLFNGAALSSQIGDVGGQDFGQGEGRKSAFFAFGPEAVTNPFGDAARAPCTLGCFGAGDAVGAKALHA